MDSEESRSTNTWPNQHDINKDISIEMDILAANGNKNAKKSGDEVFQDNGFQFEHDELPIRPRRRQKSTRLTGTKEQLYHHVLLICYPIFSHIIMLNFLFCSLESFTFLF
jgi:hypothetical protein